MQLKFRGPAARRHFPTALRSKQQRLRRSASAVRSPRPGRLPGGVSAIAGGLGGQEAACGGCRLGLSALPVSVLNGLRQGVAARAGRDRGRRRTGPARRSGFRSAGWVANRSAKPVAGVVDAHFHDRGGRAFQLAAALDLAQRRDHGVGVLGQFDRAGVGEILALARQREADHDREQPRHRDQRDGDDDGDAAAALAAVAARTGAARRRPSASRPGTPSGTAVRRRSR